MSYLLLFGWALFLIGLFWLVIKSYNLGGILWAVFVFLLTVPAGLIFCIKKKQGWLPYAIALIGWLIIIAFQVGFLSTKTTPQ